MLVATVNTRRRSRSAMPSQGTWMTCRGSISLRPHNAAAASRSVKDFPTRLGPIRATRESVGGPSVMSSSTEERYPRS